MNRAALLLLLYSCGQPLSQEHRKQIISGVEDQKYESCREHQLRLMRRGLGENEAAQYVDSVTKNNQYPCHLTEQQ